MYEKVAIVGVGLIGGSFALAMRKAGYRGAIWGVSSPPTVQAALEHGIIDDAVTLERAATEADLIYLAQPILRIICVLEDLRVLSLRKNTLVTDAGSTKVTILETAARCLPPETFLGGHPMAGKETRGPENAEADLFVDRTYFLTGDCAPQLREEFVSWVEKIGAIPVNIGADTHDTVVSLTSHLPQMLSTVLGATVSRNLPEDQAKAGAGRGLMDMTRLAMSGYDIWEEIVATNTQAIDTALSLYIAELQSLRTGLTSGALAPTFELGRKFAKSLRTPNDRQ
ncbi:MAG: prephenate dehydrogenase/arogenate dehydrogenase family protein [Bryobacterales bacterium]|nr:prephenate dehydrogenase/arogenate dehydrogenase family protein [Bryobacterales bacterium]